MRRLELTDRIRTSPRSQRFYKTESFKAFNSQQDDLKKFNTNTTDFQFLKTQSQSLHRSLSSKQKLFKSAKQIETNQRKKSNSFKNFSSHTSENFNKKITLNPSRQFTIPTKSTKLEVGTIINDKRSVEDIMSRLRNKNSIRIDVKNELINNEMKSKNFFKEQIKEPQLNLKDLIKDQVTKRLQEQKESIKQNQEIVKMKSIIEEKQSHFKKIQGKIGSKINWISQKMEEFQQRETKIKERQENIIKKEKQIQTNLLKKIQEKNRKHQQKLQRQFQDKINEIKAQQNLQNIQSKSQIISQIQNIQKHQIQILNQSLKGQNHQLNSTQNQMINSKNLESQNKNKLVKNQSHINDKLVSSYSKKQQIIVHSPKNMKQKQNKKIQADHIDIDQIKEISFVQQPKKQGSKVNKSQKVKQPQILLKKQKIPQIQPPQQKKNSFSSQNQKTTKIEENDGIEEIQLKPQTKKWKIQQKTLINQQRTKLQQNKNNDLNNKQITKKKQLILPSESKKPQPIIQKKHQKQQKQQNPPAKQPSKNKEQKMKIAQYLKVLNRVTSLLYFIGEIPHHCSSNMKKNKKYQFKVANLYLFKYVYDKFRFIEKVFQGLVTKKFITQQYYTKRVQQNQTMKETYAKLKAYVYKKQPCPPKQAESYLNENLITLCFENKNYFHEFLFKEIKTIVDFYYKDTKGKWTDHKVNLCYFRMLIAVFMIYEIEFNQILIDLQQDGHPDYMISDIEKFTEDDLRTKMNEAYQLLNDLDFNQQN